MDLPVIDQTDNLGQLNPDHIFKLIDKADKQENKLLVSVTLAIAGKSCTISRGKKLGEPWRIYKGSTVQPNGVVSGYYAANIPDLSRIAITNWVSFCYHEYGMKAVKIIRYQWLDTKQLS